MEGHPAAHRTDQVALRARRPDMSTAAAPSSASLGLRQPQDLKRILAQSEHPHALSRCPLLEVKQTSTGDTSISAHDLKRILKWAHWCNERHTFRPKM